MPPGRRGMDVPGFRLMANGQPGAEDASQRISYLGFGVIPALVAGIQPSASSGASCEMDPGHKARDDTEA